MLFIVSFFRGQGRAGLQLDGLAAKQEKTLFARRKCKQPNSSWRNIFRLIDICSFDNKLILTFLKMDMRRSEFIFPCSESIVYGWLPLVRLLLHHQLGWLRQRNVCADFWKSLWPWKLRGVKTLAWDCEHEAQRNATGICGGKLMQLLLPLDHEPCLNHQAKLMADEMVASGDCLNWDHAYECAWNVNLHMWMYMPLLLTCVHDCEWWCTCKSSAQFQLNVYMQTHM